MWKFTVLVDESALKRTRKRGNLPLELERQWQTCESVAALFSTLSLIPATLDYEFRYSEVRTNDNCSTKNDVSDAYRWLVLALTLPAAFFIILRYTIKRRWLLLKSGTGAKARHFFRSFRKWKLLALLMCTEVAMLLVFPYPGLHEVHITLSEKQMISGNSDGTYGDANYCFLLSELLYALMIGRVYFVVRAVLNYSMFADRTARRICAQYDEVANLSFTCRGLSRRHPHLFILVTVGLLCFVFSIMVRVFERPYLTVSHLEYNVMFGSMWFTITTLDIAPYGDMFTQTYPGRALCFFLAILSLWETGVAYTLMSEFMDLTSKETDTFENVKATRYAAKVIENWYVYCKLRKKVKADELRTLRANFIKAADQFAYILPRLSCKVGLSERIQKRKFQKMVDIDYLFFKIDGRMEMGLKKMERDVSHLQVLITRLDLLLYPPKP